MKKFITILTVALLAVACGVSNKTYSNDTFEAVGEGYANSRDAAWDIAYMNACEKVLSKYKSEVVTTKNSEYTQTRTGTRGSDRQTTTIQIRMLSDGALYDVVVAKEKPMGGWRCRPFKYGYELAVKVSPSNIKTYSD